MFLDPSSALSHKKRIWSYFFIIYKKFNENLNCCTSMVRKFVILWSLSSPKSHLQKTTFFMSDSFIFAEILGPILRLPETLLTFSTSALNHCENSVKLFFIQKILILMKFLLLKLKYLDWKKSFQSSNYRWRVKLLGFQPALGYPL